MTKIMLSALLTLTILSGYSHTASLQSPNGKLFFQLKNTAAYPTYTVDYGKVRIVGDSPLHFVFGDGPFGQGITFGKTITTRGEESYDLLVGKSKTVHSIYRQLTVPLVERQAPYRIVNLVVRAFDDGIAFRYEFPEQKGRTSHVILDEHTNFNLVGNPRVLGLFLPNYTSSHEGKYTYRPYAEVETGKLMDMPVLFQYGKEGVYVALTEAAVLNYAGMMLAKEEDMVTSKLSPYPGKEGVKVIAELPHRTPWRVIQVSDRIGKLIESNILTNLNEPCKIEDTSWIRPRKTTFTWWSGNVVPDTTFMPGNNFETNKYYIDFAARNGIDCHSIFGYAETAWYENDSFRYMRPGKKADVTRPIPSLDMKRIGDYAKSKGVALHLWVHWKPLYDKMEEAFAKFREWGVAGMMIDFMDRDDQQMILIQEEFLKTAAKYHLFVQFHGSSKPSGLHRTYPNEFTREGTLNYEVFKWAATPNPDHDIAMPFTRLLAGPTDYHLGGFRAQLPSEFKIQYINPHVMGTRCHMLAMYIVLESYLTSLCDTPKAYEGQPGFEFLQNVPSTWDETRVPAAEVMEYITVARRKGGDWYVGTINNSSQRTIVLKLDFLGNGPYIAEIYSDAPDVDKNPNKLEQRNTNVIRGDSIVLKLASGGGSVLRIRPEK